MILLAVFLSFLAFLIDLFFIAGLLLPVRVSISLLVVVLFILARRERAGLTAAVLTGFLKDLSSLFLPFGTLLIWHGLFFLVAQKFFTSFFAINKQSSIVIFSFLTAWLFYAGEAVIWGGEAYLVGRAVEFSIGNLTLKIIVSSLLFSFLVLASLAGANYSRRLLRRWFLIR